VNERLGRIPVGQEINNRPFGQSSGPMTGNQLNAVVTGSDVERQLRAELPTSKESS